MLNLTDVDTKVIGRGSRVSDLVRCGVLREGECVAIQPRRSQATDSSQVLGDRQNGSRVEATADLDCECPMRPRQPADGVTEQRPVFLNELLITCAWRHW